MALEFAHGSIQWLTSQAVNATITVSGLGFEPKAIRFYWTGIQSNSPTDAVSGALNMRAGVGFAVSTASRRSIGIFDQDNTGTANCGSVAANNCVVITVDGNGAVDGRLDISNIGVDGFTLIVDDVTPANLTVNYEAWGGTDITVAVIGDAPEPAATGTQNYTVTGFDAAGTDQVVMFAGCQATTALNTGQATDAGLTAGFATSTSATNQVVIVGNSDDGSGSADTDGYSYEGECLAMITNGGSTIVNARANLSAWGTNQFTLNWSARATSNRRYVFLAIKGGKWQAGSYTINSTSAGNTATISGLSFQPNGITAFSRDFTNDTAGTATVDSVFCFGTASSTALRRSLGVNSDHGVDPMVINQIIRYDSYLAAPNFAGGVRALYDINALNTDGWQIIVDTANGAVSTVRQYYLTFGNEPVTPTPTPTITPTLTPTITPTQGGGGITFIGSSESTGTSITLPAGLQEGDIVIIVSGSDGTAQNLPTGYTNGQNGASGVSYRWSYKFMGAIPDTTATGLSSTSVHISFAFRGVDTSNPLDVTPPTVATNTAGMPNSPSITTVNDGCVVIPIGYLDDDVVAASVTAPAGYTLARAAQYGSAGAGATVMAAYLLQTTAGAENPAAFGGTGDDAWVGATVALRPIGGIAPSPTPTPTITPTFTPTPTVTETPGICKIELVGTPTESTTTSIDLPTGLQENDLVIIISASDGTAQTTPDTFTLGQQDTNTAPVSRWSYKFMGATPDTTATGLAGTSVHAAFAFRNVDTTTPFDVASPTMATGGAGMPNSPSITTVTARSGIVSIGFLDDDVVAASVTAPDGFTLIEAAQYGSAGNGATVMSAFAIQNTAGAIDPGVFRSTGGDDAWVAATIALRFSCNQPAGTPTPTPTRTPTPTTSPQPIPGGIVTNGLVLYLDPGNTSSYPGTGTNWTDLSPQGNNGTLVNSPTYFPYAYSGTFYFDGATQYVDLGTPASLNTGTQTYQLWVRAKTPDDGNNNQLWSRTNTNAGTFNVLKRNTGFWGSNLRLAADPSIQTNQDSSQIARTNWRNITLTYDGTDLKFYWDGVEDASTNVPGLIDTASFAGMNIMRNTTGVAYFQGLLGVVLCYNRALTPAEIVQNYDAFYDRYLQRPQFQTIGHPFII